MTFLTKNNIREGCGTRTQSIPNHISTRHLRNTRHDSYSHPVHDPYHESKQIKMVSVTTLLAFSAGALASPALQDRQIAIPDNWNWHVSG
jgi:hypothetical protein